MYLASISHPITSGSFTMDRIANNFPAGGAVRLCSGSMYSRRAVTIFNHSNASLYISPRQDVTGSAAGNFMVKITSGSYYEMLTPVYLHEIWGAWDGAGGSALVVDFQASE